MTATVVFDSRKVDDLIADYVNENAKEIARAIAKDAKASVHSETGMLKRSIKAKKSKFKDGGWITKATAPHAHLVEYGHGGSKPAPAHPFLRTALDKNIAAARVQFGAK